MGISNLLTTQLQYPKNIEKSIEIQLSIVEKKKTLTLYKSDLMNSENKILKIHQTILFLGSIDIPFQNPPHRAIK